MTINVDKQVSYWREGAEEDWEVGRDLVTRGKTRHGLFFIHLALEKTLKAHVCRATKDLAPRLHSLPRLAEQSQLGFSDEHASFLSRFDRYDIAARYPGTLGPPPSMAEAKQGAATAEEVYQWLKNQL
jgi:HEPN domain-containing protein